MTASTRIGAGRLAEAFGRIRASGSPGLVTYITAGDPDLARTEGIITALDRLSRFPQRKTTRRQVRTVRLSQVRRTRCIIISARKSKDARA
jgi:hypothetical protein